MTRTSVRDWIQLRRHTEKQRRRARKLLQMGSPWVFSRTACLGNDVFALLGTNLPRINVQKGRVDGLRSAMADQDGWQAPWRWYKTLDRRDVWPLIVEQELPWWCAEVAPEFILMDSYSELTDQGFHDPSTGRTFFANFTDLDPERLHSAGILSVGLLPTEGLEQRYRLLFESLHGLWPGVRVVFVHFPSDLETRVKFRERAELIRAAIERLAAEDSLLESVSLRSHRPSRPEAAHEVTEFPYHYDAPTYHELALSVSEKLR